MTNNTRFLRSAAAGLGLLTVAGAAMAQEAESFSRPLRAPKGEQTTTASRSTTTMRSDDGQNQVEVRIENGKITAKANGKSVPEDRIVREGDRVRIMGADGEVLAEFNQSDTPQPPKAPKAPKAAKAPKAPKPPTSWTPFPDQPAGWTPPKVMIGITMGEPSEDALKDHDLKEGQAILIERVIEGLPADKAGLKADDIITEIDGQKPANQEKLRE